MARCLIGTCGWSYDHWADDVFYPPGLKAAERLGYYAGRFDALEVDSTFYHLPAAEVARRWAEQTPAGFRFAVKGSRLITHVKRLRDSREALQAFFGRVRGLGRKLEVVLWQLPPGLLADTERLADFCALLDEIAPEPRHAFEFRHESWFAEPVYEILRDRGHALVIAHSVRYPRAEVVTSDFVYLRFHGGENGVDSSYSAAELAEWAARARDWAGQGLDLYGFFNNDEAGYAPRDAASFQDLACVDIS
jgi:uncharacterized protein YecE (DUF72 family)